MTSFVDSSKARASGTRHSAELAEWWRAAGADFGTGDHSGAAGTPGEFVTQTQS